MSFTTIIGILSGFALIIVSILLETSKFGIFVSFSSLMMVVGGTVAGTLIGQEARYVFLALKGVLKTYKAQDGGRETLLSEVGKIIDWSYGVQKNGVLALEKEVDTVKDDALMTFGINVILASHNGDTVRSIMQNFSDNAYIRRNVQVDILNVMASLAPAFGMVGTLVGLIIMLANMGDDPAALGAGLAIALNTTLYGVIVAKMVFGPAASKLEQRSDIEHFVDNLKVEGLALLADQVSPREVQDRLNSYIDPELHFDIDEHRK